MLDKKMVKKMYLCGYNANEISKRMGVNKETTKKCIQRNFSDVKYVLEHKKNRVKLKDCIRAINRTNNNYIGNAQLVSWNRHSYNINKNGTLIYNAQRGVIPGDMPTYYKKVFI